uniref:Phosphatidylcholine transfer protein n=1 Tax=Esox lucius TaxID=8010 RepID=A0AAY5KK73_ESOLU
MSLHFTDGEFLEAWKELDEPNLEGGWEFFTETMVGVCAFRFDFILTIKYCCSMLNDCSFVCVCISVFAELYEKDYDGQSAIYWEVKYPFPLSNRDYVYVRERRDVDADGRKVYVVLAKSSPQSPLPEKSGVQRVNDYKQSVAMESDGACGTKVFMNYFDNPGGNIPTWLVNWAAKSGVPAFITDMQKACSNYSNYCQKNKK